MPNTTLYPNGDIAATSWTISGGPTTIWEAVSNGTSTPDDTDYIEASSTFSTAAEVTLADLPEAATEFTGASVVLRYRVNEDKDTPDRTVKLKVIDSADTALTNEVESSTPSTWTTSTIAFTVTDATLSKWNDARLMLTRAGSDGDVQIAEVEIYASYGTDTGDTETSDSMILRPTLAVNNVFDTSNVLLIDDPVVAPAAGDGSTVEADHQDDDDEQIYGGFEHESIGSVADVFDHVTSVKVHVRLKDGGGSDDWVDVRILIDGVWESTQRITATSSMAWYEKEFTHTDWDPLDVDDIQVGLAVGNNPDMFFDVLYLEVNGTTDNEDGIPDDEALPVQPYCAFQWLPFYNGTTNVPDAGITVTSGTITGAVNTGDVAPSEVTYIHLPDNNCELWFNLGQIAPDYWQTHHFDFRLHHRRTDAAQGTTSAALLYMQLFEWDGVTEITDEILMNTSTAETWANTFYEDVTRTGRSKLPVMVNARLRLRQDYQGGDANEIAQCAVFSTYVPQEVSEYTCKPVGDGTTVNYTSTESSNWEATDNGTATPDDAELLTITDSVGSVFLQMGPNPPADFYQPLHIQTDARVKVSTMAGNRHNTLIGYYTEGETDAFAGGVAGSAPPQAGAFFSQDHPDLTSANTVGTYYDWNEKTQTGSYTADPTKDAMTDWRLKLGSTQDNGTHTISEVECEVKYSKLPEVSYVAFERIMPEGDGTVGSGIVSTESSMWEAINTRVQLSDNSKYITFPDADAELFVTLASLPPDIESVHHFAIWCKFVRVSATGDYSDLLLQVFAADETTALSDERLVTKDVHSSIYSWKHYGSIDVRRLGQVTDDMMDGARLRIRQAYSGGSAMRVTAAHIEVSYNPREIASVVLRPASDGNSSTALSPGSIVPSPAWPATASANDATYIRASEDSAYQEMLLGPAVPTNFRQVLHYELRFRARQSELHPKLTPSVELDSTSWLNGTGQQRFETLRLNEDVDTSWGDFATLEQSDSNAVTVTAFDTDANTFGFASPTGIYAPKLISSFVFNAKGTPSSGSVTLKVWMRINHVWTSVKTLVFTGGYQHRSAAWDGYALSQNQLDDLQVQVWFDGLSGSDTFSFEYCEVTIEGVTPQKNTTIQSPLIGYGDPVDTWQDFSLPVYHGATPHGFHTVTSLTLAGGGVADRDTWVWPMVTVEHAFNASTGGSSSGTFDVSEVEVVVWYSAFMNVPSSTYLFRLMQGTNTMIRDAANQRWWVYAFDVSTGLPKTGDASNITATIFQNNGSSVGTDDTNPNELGNGFYTFDLTQAETAAHTITLIPVSSTENISVVPCPAVVSPHPANYGLLGIEVDGDITKVNTLHGHTAQTADHETRLAAAASSLTAQDAILSALPDAGALTDLGTITDRLGAFTGTGINNVLGFLKALGSKAATAPSDMGGTFAPSDDSLEAIRDRGDAAYVPPSTGSGAYDVTITVEDEADNPLGGAQVRMVLGASVSEGTTATDGTLTLKCDNGSWDIGITHVTSVSYSGTVTVNGNTTPATFELAQTVTSTPSDAGRSTGQILLMTDGSPDVGATYSILYSRGGDLAGVSADRSIQTATTNSSGIAQFPNLIQDAYYTLLGRGDGTVAASVSPFARRSADRLGEFQVPATNPFLITE